MKFNNSVRIAVIGAVVLLLGVFGRPQSASAYSVTYSDTWSISDSQTVGGSTNKSTVSVTNIDDTLSLNYFSLSGYKLTGVTLVYTFDSLTLSGTLTAATATTITGGTSQISTSVDSSTLENDGYDVFKKVDGTKGVVSNVTVSSDSTTGITSTRTLATRSISYSDAEALTYFNQEGSFGLSVSSVISLSYDASGAVSMNTSGTDTGTVQVVYTYEAVPEPATWAMLFGGVGTLMLVQQLRRRHHA